MVSPNFIALVKALFPFDFLLARHDRRTLAHRTNLLSLGSCPLSTRLLAGNHLQLVLDSPGSPKDPLRHQDLLWATAQPRFAPTICFSFSSWTCSIAWRG